jgi:hypothetical protein
MTKWRDKITDEMRRHKDNWQNVVSMHPEEENWLDYLFDDDFGSIEGESFTVWTKKRVYFPVTYDGSEWVGSVSRAPDGKSTEHIGG